MLQEGQRKDQMGSNLNKTRFKHFLDWQLTISCWNDGDFCGLIWYQFGPKKIVNELIFFVFNTKIPCKTLDFCLFSAQAYERKIAKPSLWSKY